MVLHINKDQAHLISNIEAIERWHQLFNGSLLSQRLQRKERLIKAELLHRINRLKQMGSDETFLLSQQLSRSAHFCWPQSPPSQSF